MSREQYAWGSLRRTGRQFVLLALLVAIGFVLLVVSILVFGPGE
jgi:hypothetical protein